MKKQQGQRNDLGTSGGKPHKLDVLKEAGIAPRQASDWERLSEVPEDQFEDAVATKLVRELIDKSPPINGDALLDNKKVRAAKAEAEKLIEDLFGLATRSLKHGNLSHDDDLLASGSLSLVTGSRELMRNADQSNSGAPGYEAYEAIARTIRGAALIGSTAIFTKKYFLARQKAKYVRDVKRIKDDKTKQHLDDAIVAVAKEQGLRLYISANFANIVRSGVAKRLSSNSSPSDFPANPPKLSDTTIKNSVRRILKKRVTL